MNEQGGGKPLTQVLFIGSSLGLPLSFIKLVRNTNTFNLLDIFVWCWTIYELDSKGRSNSLTSLSRLNRILMCLIAGNPLHSLTHAHTISPQALSKGAREKFCLCRAGWFRSLHMPAARQLLSTMFANSISCVPRSAFTGLKSTGHCVAVLSVWLGCVCTVTACALLGQMPVYLLGEV